MNLRSLRCLLPVFTVPVLLLGCASTADDGDSSQDAITAVPETGARDQKETGNCWLYATAGWAESLEYSAMIEAGKAVASDPLTRPLHMSPTYWDYWDWYTKITDGAVKGRTQTAIKDQLDTGGSWGAAVEIAARYGVARTRKLIGDNVTNEADHTATALAAMAKSLATGTLRTVASRKDRALVRRELDAAFAFVPGVTESLTEAFGDGSKTFSDGTARGNDIVESPSDLRVKVPRRGGSPIVISLSEAIGVRQPGTDPDKRTGPNAWSVIAYEPENPAGTREFFRRIQRALHENVPLPISWYKASNGDEGHEGRYMFSKEPASTDGSGAHETLIDDYEAEDVPGFGRLAAGAPASDEAKAAAALSDGARVVFLRVKNSWGRTANAFGPAGFNDLFFDYLTGTLRVCPEGASATSSKCTEQVPLEDVTLPPGY